MFRKQLGILTGKAKRGTEGGTGKTGRGLTAQLELGVDLLIGYIAHKERKTPGIPESGGQAIQQSSGSLVNGRAQSPLRLKSGESGGETHAQRVRMEPLCCEAQFPLPTGNTRETRSKSRSGLSPTLLWSTGGS